MADTYTTVLGLSAYINIILTAPQIVIIIVIFIIHLTEQQGISCTKKQPNNTQACVHARKHAHTHARTHTNTHFHFQEISPKLE